MYISQLYHIVVCEWKANKDVLLLCQIYMLSLYKLHKSNTVSNKVTQYLKSDI